MRPWMVVLVLCCVGFACVAQDFEITAIETDGTIRWEMLPDHAYTVQVRSDPAEDWEAVASRYRWPITTSQWPASRDDEWATSGRRFYRVAATHAPAPGGMVLIPTGSFTMGDTSGTGHANERPVHDVYVSAFYMGRTEVTNSEMAEMMQWAFDRGLVTASATTVRNSEGSQQELLNLDGSVPQISFTGSAFTVDAGKGDFPCVHVSWYGALAYCNYRSDREGLSRCVDFADWSCDFTGNGYRLPTEAEWEKAARGGQSGHYYPWPSKGGSCADHIDGSKANYWESGDSYENAVYPRTTPVGYYDGNQTPAGVDMANGYGLYDMAGNVWEYCWDWKDLEWYGNAAADDPDTTGPVGPLGSHVLRGGSWYYGPYLLRCASRYSFGGSQHHFNGFRCARGL